MRGGQRLWALEARALSEVVYRAAGAVEPDEQRRPHLPRLSRSECRLRVARLLVSIPRLPARTTGSPLLCPLPASAPGGLLTILYIQPQASSSAEHTIDFTRVARVVEERGALGPPLRRVGAKGSGNDDKILE